MYIWSLSTGKAKKFLMFKISNATYDQLDNSEKDEINILRSYSNYKIVAAPKSVYYKIRSP